MDSKTNDIKEFFDEAVKIKEERGKRYDNGGKSAYERSLDMFDKKNKIVASVWPVAQKASRLVSVAEVVQEIQNGNSTLSLSDAIESMNDTSKDLANYIAMQWVRNVKPYLKKGEQK